MKKITLLAILLITTAFTYYQLPEQTHVRPDHNGGYMYFERDPYNNIPRQRTIRPDHNGGWYFQ